MSKPVRKTKIICTIGPATWDEENLIKLAKAGMNVARLNMSHGDHESHKKTFNRIRGLEKKGYSLAIAMDIQGPAIRTGDLPAPLKIKKDDEVTFTIKRSPHLPELTTTVSYDEFVKDVSVGDKIIVDNGELEMEIVKKTKTDVIARALESHTLGNRRHINLPGAKVSLPGLTAKDKKDLKFMIEMDVDYINLSFVRNGKIVRDVRKMIEKAGKNCKVIAKIENQEALDNIDEILNEADGVMVARGDLGVEVPFEEVPLIQKHLIDNCIETGKPVIVATNMLESMIENPIPTRAEVTDVSTAVFQRSGAIMLSGETTIGKHPFKCVEAMDRIARKVEEELSDQIFKVPADDDLDREMTRSATYTAKNLNASAIIVFTKTGRMAELISKCRPTVPIFAFTDNLSVARKLNLHWGVYSKQVKFTANPEVMIENALKEIKSSKGNSCVQGKCLMKGERVIIISDILVGKTRVDSALQVRTV